MTNGILIAVAYFWLIALSIHHYLVFRDLEDHRHEKV